jgi:hypothetical protein
MRTEFALADPLNRRNYEGVCTRRHMLNHRECPDAEMQRQPQLARNEEVMSDADGNSRRSMIEVSGIFVDGAVKAAGA